MKSIDIFLFEWTHFIRNPFKVVALILFVLAAVYGLHNGASLYHKQNVELVRIQETIEEDRQKYLDLYDQGKKGPENSPWIDINTPFWAIWFNYIYKVKEPSPAMVFSMGQAEQYGYYKRVTFWSSPFDADMTNEITNPERLQTGTLDFSFAILFLLPLLLLTLLYNLQSVEAEQGFLPLIEIQAASRNTWLLSRFAFYLVFVFLTVLGLLFYGASLTGVLTTAYPSFLEMVMYTSLYLFLWTALFYFIIWSSGKSVISNTLKMVGLWIFFAFIMPASVHQWISIQKPANLMTDFIDANREETYELYDLPDSVLQNKLNLLYPEIVNSPVARDSTKKDFARNYSTSALVNDLLKKSIVKIEEDTQDKNKRIESTFVFNPLGYFQNQFNAIAQTHFNDYQVFRHDVQQLIDKQIETLVLDTWNDLEIDKEKYNTYHENLKSI